VSMGGEALQGPRRGAQPLLQLSSGVLEARNRFPHLQECVLEAQNRFLHAQV
jgi:hypothetical protein